jgi:hypothetical protein
MPYSPGLKADIADPLVVTDSEDEHMEQQGKLYIGFPINIRTRKPDPVTLQIDVQADEFVVQEPTKLIPLISQRNSNQFIFRLMPVKNKPKSTIYVTVKQQTLTGTWVELGSLRLTTIVQPSGMRRFAQLAISVASLSLSRLSRPQYADFQSLNQITRRRSDHRKAMTVMGRNEPLLKRLSLRDDFFKDDFHYDNYRPAFFEHTFNVIPVEEIVAWALKAIIMADNLDQMRFVVQLFPIIQTTFFINNLQRALEKSLFDDVSSEIVFERLQWLGHILENSTN